MSQNERTVFISYRRKDSAWALAVYQYLTSRDYDVFLDFTSIPSGDFEQNIVGNIRGRPHFVLILTPSALDRCGESGDWLRREIETAIDEKRNIIPLFFDDFSFGSPSVKEKLTGKLSILNRYNGVDVPMEYFDAAMERLRKFLNTPLEAVIHPLSPEVAKATKDEQLAVSKSLKAIPRKDIHLFEIVRVPDKQIGIITGDVLNIKEIDIWVVPEDTEMVMARPYERSMSAQIRYGGARKNKAGYIKDDVIADALYKVMDGEHYVYPGTVLPTTSGELENTNNVKSIFHAASVVGQVGRGYMPIKNVADCVQNALKLADHNTLANENLRSILFPLMGTGTALLSAEGIVKELIDAALAYIEENPKSKIDKIYFLAYYERDRDICMHIFSNDARVAT